jgi:exopolyphosphatase/guanosine-5'-triphosphate,3'-diphosphate pyrophosphatase
VIEEQVPAEVRSRAAGAVAVAGTATSCASIDLELDPYDPERVEGHRLSRGRIEELRDRLAALPLAQRRDVTGLDPSRAPTIVAGTVVLLQVLGAFELDAIEVSERDILWGVALDSRKPL